MDGISQLVQTHEHPMIATMKLNLAGFIFSVLSLSAVNADKDISYYQANHGNPNVNMKMYWKDAENILADLSQFSSLHVQYHSCVWSYIYGQNYENEENGGDENDYWYMGSVPSMGANVAFSLYGSLSGEKFGGCNAKTFINSFYTNSGFSDFTQAMQNAGISVSSSGDYSQCQNGKGIGCDYYNGFALHTYSTSECNPKYFTSVANTMDDLNESLNSVQCTEIYDGSDWSDDDQYTNNLYGSPLQLLKYSSACNYMNYWSPDGNCPDPYGKIATYIKNYNGGISSSHPDPYQTFHSTLKLAGTYTLIGALCFVLAGMTIGAFGHASRPGAKTKISKFKGKVKSIVSKKRGSRQEDGKKKKSIKGMFTKPQTPTKETSDVDKFEDENIPQAFDSKIKMSRTASHSSSEDV